MFCQSGFEFIKRNLGKCDHNYLEIGVFNGDSIAAIAREYPSKKVYGVDPFIEDGCTTHTTGVQRYETMPVQRATTYRNIDGIDNITMFEMTSRDFLDQLTDQQVLDLDVSWMLIDGSHHYEDVAIDIQIADRLIGSKPGGIVFDDLNLPDVRRAYDEFLSIMGDRAGPLIDLYNAHPGHIVGHLLNYK